VRNAYVDRLRGLAELMVVLSHACGYIPAIFYHFPDELRVAIMQRLSWCFRFLHDFRFSFFLSKIRKIRDMIVTSSMAFSSEL
jgi:hypothetical protein